jgi:RNA polymerase sigma factor (sigma-70 family)
MESLTEKVLAFQRSNDGYEELVAALSPRIYQYPRQKLGWDEDSCGDFYLFFQPRLTRLLQRFRDQGKPFETYLCSVLSWQLKNFARDRRKSERGWSVSLRLVPVEDEAEERDEADACPLPDPMDPRLRMILGQKSDRRNFLLLCLKCVRVLSSGRIAGLSGLTGVPEQDLCGLVSELRARIAKKERRLECFRERRNRAFALCRLLETELSEETDPARRETLRVRLEKARGRMNAAMRRMSKVMLNPTNREIAEVLGMPKGTVDSGLFWLKRKLASVYDPCGLQSA